MKIMADKHTCEGLGMCEAMAPDFFEVGEDGFVDVLESQPGEADRLHVKAAVAACPVSALRLEG